jgi:hypothetical protein
VSHSPPRSIRTAGHHLRHARESKQMSAGQPASAGRFLNADCVLLTGKRCTFAPRHYVRLECLVVAAESGRVWPVFGLVDRSCCC